MVNLAGVFKEEVKAHQLIFFILVWFSGSFILLLFVKILILSFVSFFAFV